jgi:hypothetical protein
MTYGELRAISAGWVTSHVINDACDNARFELGKNFKNEPVSEYDLRTIREVRYEVRRVATEDCDSVRDETEYSTSDLAEANDYAARVDSPFGAAVVDTATGLIDYGFGFGQPVPDLEA